MLHYLIDLIFDTAWFFLPALLANGAPVLGAKILSQNKIFRKFYTPISVSLFGKNKTYGGWLLGILTAVLVVLIQDRLILIGLIMGIGTMAGDSIKSFFKRRAKIKEGKYIFWDTIDWYLGVLLLLLITNTLPDKEIIITSIFICPIIVALVNFISFKVKVKRSL
ncbi:MAG: CDP-archaeol synthase [Candidatus Pacebacteria bacterium]|nr:CDP-archaeol synthase [Candidatus Paceibacterota bacterium]